MSNTPIPAAGNGKGLTLDGTTILDNNSVARSLLDAALAYAAAGIPVFPLHSTDADGRCSCSNPNCRDAGKHPRTSNGFHDATTDLGVITRWWTRWPGANIGYPTGKPSGLYVLDVDGKTPEGARLADMMSRDAGLIVDATLVRTPGKSPNFTPGLHAVVQSDANVQSRVLGIGELRGTGGYVVAPPSRRHGRAYTTLAENVLVVGDPLKWTRELLAAFDYEVPEQPQRLDPEDEGRIPDGQRNSTLASMAGTMRQRGFSEAAIVAALLETNRTKCDPPLAEDEVEKVARSVSRYAPGELVQPVFDLATSTVSSRQDLSLWKPSGYSAGALMALDLPEPRHVVDGLIAEGSGILAGRPKIGKSWFAWQLAIAVARGDKVFGDATTNGGSVAYLALEDNTRRLKSRLGKLLAGSEPPARLTVFNEWRRLDNGGLEALDEWLTNATDPRLVIIDTFAKVKPRRPRNTDPYDHDHHVMSMLTTLAGQHHVAILLVHHTRKAQSDDFIDSVTGTLGLSGGTDATLVLARSRGQTDATLSITGRDVDEQELALNFDGDTCTWRLMGDADEYRLGTARRDIVNVIIANKQPMMPSEVAKVLDKNRNTIRWHMAEMAKDGTLKPWDDGKYTLPVPDPREVSQQGQQDKPLQHPQQGRGSGVGPVEGDGPVGPVGSLHRELPTGAGTMTSGPDLHEEVRI